MVRITVASRKCLKTLASDMLALVLSTQFKRDMRRAKKRGKEQVKIQELIEFLRKQELLPERYQDHQLKGIWKGYGEVHIEPDWLLVCRIEDDKLHLVRTGSHSSLFISS